MPLQVNVILQETARLPLNDQEFIVETLTKRLRELRRAEIAARAQEAEANYRGGHAQSGTVDDVLNIGAVANGAPCLTLKGGKCYGRP